jgi:hypothetical protein
VTTETVTKYYTGPTGRFAMRVDGTLYFAQADIEGDCNRRGGEFTAPTKTLTPNPPSKDISPLSTIPYGYAMAAGT